MSKWISADNDLPKDFYRAKLVWVESESGNGTYSMGYIKKDEEWCEWMTNKPMSEFGYKVIAWQELPDEYREESRDE